MVGAFRHDLSYRLARSRLFTCRCLLRLRHIEHAIRAQDKMGRRQTAWSRTKECRRRR